MSDPHLSQPNGMPPRPVAPARPKEDFSSVALVDEAPTATAQVHHVSKIQALGVQAAPEKHYARKPTLTGRGAARVKTFHGHMSEDGLRRMDEKINDWLEAHPSYEVKFATSMMGIWDGKTKEPAIICSVFC